TTAPRPRVIGQAFSTLILAKFHCSAYRGSFGFQSPDSWGVATPGSARQPGQPTPAGSASGILNRRCGSAASTIGSLRSRERREGARAGGAVNVRIREGFGERSA